MTVLAVFPWLSAVSLSANFASMAFGYCVTSQACPPRAKNDKHADQVLDMFAVVDYDESILANMDSGWIQQNLNRKLSTMRCERCGTNAELWRLS